MAMSEQFKLTERFKRVSETEVLYRNTVNDPLAYTRPFTVARTIALCKPNQLIFEVASHEGYSATAGILASVHRGERRNKTRENKKWRKARMSNIGGLSSKTLIAMITRSDLRLYLLACLFADLLLTGLFIYWPVYLLACLFTGLCLSVPTSSQQQYPN
jgi:hypothetical protein